MDRRKALIRRFT